jgi:hypothetical protein
MRAVGGAAAAPSYPAVVVVAAVEVAVFVDVGDIDEHPRHSTATAASNASRRTIEPYSSSRSLIRGEGHRTATHAGMWWWRSTSLIESRW